MLSSPPAAADLADGGAGAHSAAGRPLAAHRGFLTRARSIPIRQLYAEARARGKRLVLCGASWNGGGGGGGGGRPCVVGRVSSWSASVPAIADEAACGKHHLLYCGASRVLTRTGCVTLD